MGVFVDGRLSAIHEIGSLIENMSIAYEKEIIELEALKFAFSVCIKEFIDKKNEISDIAKCVTIVKRLHKDAETKRQNAIGARDCLIKLVTNVKTIYDVEMIKQNVIGKKRVKNAG
jgi:hypothetical protein